jgi:hypothetical protein
VCGTGLGLLGTGTTATCETSTSAGGGGNGGGNDGGGNNGGASGSHDGSGLLTEAASVVAAVASPGQLAQGSLAFTGGNPELTALLGMGLAGAGALMLRLRRFGYKG